MIRIIKVSRISRAIRGISIQVIGVLIHTIQYVGPSFSWPFFLRDFSF